MTERVPAAVKFVRLRNLKILLILIKDRLVYFRFMFVPSRSMSQVSMRLFILRI